MDYLQYTVYQDDISLINHTWSSLEVKSVLFFWNLLRADSHLRCCHRAACCTTGTEPSVPHSTSPRSEAQGQCTPCRRTPPHLHMFWSTAATVPMSSSRHPQPPVVKRSKKNREKKSSQSSWLELSAKGNLSWCSLNHSLGFLDLRPRSVLARRDFRLNLCWSSARACCLPLPTFLPHVSLTTSGTCHAVAS